MNIIFVNTKIRTYNIWNN